MYNQRWDTAIVPLSKVLTLNYFTIYTLSEHLIRFVLDVLLSAAGAYPIKRFDMLCFQRCSSVYRSCNVWLFTFLSALTSLALFH